jgi:very-short-patch-repair endonuclease
LIEAFGLDSDQEIERLRFEQGSNFMSEQSFGAPSFSMNFSSGPVSGEGFGATPPPAGPGGPAPVEVPPPAPGGAPAAPAPATPAAPAPTAATRDKMYKTASSIMNGIYYEIIDDKFGFRTAATRFKSAAHEGFVKSLRPVTGRGYIGTISDTYEGLYGNLRSPVFGGESSYPLNYEALEDLKNHKYSENENIRFVVSKKIEKPQAKLFTSLEKKLYAMLTSLNMPYALYAQYSAGPTMDYQLDAAIPSLKIGLEADGEIWHNNQEKISKDKRRDSELASHGWIIVRFTDKELNDHPQDCINVLIQAIKRRTGSTNTDEDVI